MDALLDRHDLPAPAPREDLAALARLARLVAGADVAAVNLLDATTQHQVVAVGGVAQDCAAEESLCAVAVAEPRLQHVTDASAEPAFAGSPWVDGRRAAIRGYAAAPLVLPDGRVLGTLCVFSDRPAALSPEQLQGLRDLAGQAVALLERGREAREAAERAALFRLVAEGGTDVLARTRLDGTVRWVSPSVQHVLGHDPAALVGTDTFSLVHPHDVAAAQASLAGVVHGSTSAVRLRLRHAGGGWRTLEVRSSPLHDAAGTVVEVHVAGRDVTEQVAAEQARRESERRYRQLVEQTPDAILVHVDGVLVFANPAAGELLGAPVQDLLGAEVAALNDPALDAVLCRRTAQVLAGEPVPLLRQRLRRPDGRTVAVEMSCVRVDIEGRAGIQHVVRAVRDQESAQRALEDAHRDLAQARDERAQLRDVLDVAGDVHLVGDAHGRPVEWNRAAEGLFGITREQALSSGQRIGHLVMDEQQRQAWAPLRAALMARDPQALAQRHELHMRAADGRLLLVEGSWWVVTAPDGSDRLHGLMRDIGHRREQEAELEAARDAALAASSAKTAFLANMSHEIRTPLNGVLGMTALLRDSGLPPQQTEWAQLAHQSGQGLLSVVNDILDLAKIEAGRLDVVHRVFDLRQLLADALAPLRAAAAAKSLDLRLEVADDLPRTVSGDPDRLRQVLVNLLGNAVKFTDAGSVVLSAEAGLGRAVWLAVSDTGPGIAEEDQERLFEPFAQADASTTRRFGGTGLGLAISRDLVQVLGGELLVSSSLGAGSTFSFSLPLVDLEAPVPAETAPAPAVPAPRRGGRLLLAEDSMVNQLVAVELLGREGFQVDVVDDGQQALDRLREDLSYDALLLDCQMPVLDGYDTARALRALEAEQGRPRLPVLALTAAAFTEDRERCLAAGMDDYLSKPFVPADVVTALDRLTAR